MSLLGRFTEPGRLARVEYDQASADAAFAGLRVAPEVKGPGLSQADAVQCATQLAVLRSGVTNGGRGPIAVFDAQGRFLRMVEVIADRRGLADELVRRGERVVFVVGKQGTPLIHADPGQGVPKNWGLVLALALDRQCRVIADAEMGPNVPIGFADLRETFFPGVPAILLVAGAALSVIGAVAAWRYLDPDARREMLEVREAARHYSERLHIFEQTGRMPAPSDIEKATAGRAERAASEEKGGDWGVGVAIGGGFAAGTLLAGALSS